MTDSDDTWTQLCWPVVLRYGDGDQLSVVSSRDEWDIDPDFHAWPYRDEDRLIDAKGIEYRLAVTSVTAAGGVTVEATGREYAAADFQDLAERHLKALGAPVEWLAAYLQEFRDGQRIGATVQYIARISKTGAPESSEEDEE